MTKVNPSPEASAPGTQRAGEHAAVHVADATRADAGRALPPPPESVEIVKVEEIQAESMRPSIPGGAAAMPISGPRTSGVMPEVEDGLSGSDEPPTRAGGVDEDVTGWRDGHSDHQPKNPGRSGGPSHPGEAPSRPPGNCSLGSASQRAKSQIELDEHDAIQGVP
jgi:hypothetical protein